MPSMRVVGPGRAGSSLSRCLAAAGWVVADPLGRGDDLRSAASGVDLLVITTPDSVISEVAAAVEPEPETVVAHMAGSLGLEVLDPHRRRAALHPLRAIATAETELAGAWFAVAGDPIAEQAVAAVGGRSVAVADEDRASYHAAACIASNHLVALMGQVQRVAAPVGVPLEAYIDLARGALDAVERLGPAAALTGPVRRGDHATVARHLQALPGREQEAYRALAAAAALLLPDHQRDHDGAPCG